MIENRLKGKGGTALFGLLLSFIVLTALVISGVTQAFDEAVLALVADNTPDYLSDSLHILTFMGNTLFIFFASLIVTYLFYRADEKKLSYHFAGMMLLSGAAVVLLKYTVRRPRPALEGIHYLVYGYPSGHSTGAFTFFLGAYVFYFMLYKREHDFLYLSLCLIFPSIVAVSRLVLGVHYLTDVIGGFLLSGILISSFWLKMER